MRNKNEQQTHTTAKTHLKHIPLSEGKPSEKAEFLYDSNYMMFWEMTIARTENRSVVAMDWDWRKGQPQCGWGDVLCVMEL